MLPLSKSKECSGNQLTLYIKGFLQKDEAIQNFSEYMECHNRLVEKRVFDAHACGYVWNSGKLEPQHFVPISPSLAYQTYTYIRGASSVSFEERLLVSKHSTMLYEYSNGFFLFKC